MSERVRHVLLRVGDHRLRFEGMRPLFGRIAGMRKVGGKKSAQALTRKMYRAERQAEKEETHLVCATNVVATQHIYGSGCQRQLYSSDFPVQPTVHAFPPCGLFTISGY